MSDIIIHKIRLSYEEADERVRNFVHYLKNGQRKEEMEAFYEKAKNSQDGKIYLQDKAGNEFTLICNSAHNCALGLRGAGFI